MPRKGPSLEAEAEGQAKVGAAAGRPEKAEAAQCSKAQPGWGGDEQKGPHPQRVHALAQEERGQQETASCWVEMISIREAQTAKLGVRPRCQLNIVLEKEEGGKFSAHGLSLYP